MATIANNLLLNVDKKILLSFQAGARQYIPTYDKIFNIDKPQRKDEKYGIIKLDNAAPEVADGTAFPESSITEVGDATITTKVFKAAVPISDLSEAFDNYGAIEQAASRKSYQFIYAIDQLGANFVNNATSSTGAYGFSIAGTTNALVGDTQTVGDTGVTFDNKITGSLDKTTLNQAIVQMMTMPTHENIIAGYQARRLLVPVVEKMNAWQLTNSPDEPESANRNLNYLNSLGIQVIPWALYTNTGSAATATACMLLADKGENGARGLRYVVTEMPTIRRILSQTTGNWVYQVRMLLNAGVTDWQGIVGLGY